jgi:two-component system OmpR family response regulator
MAKGRQIGSFVARGPRRFGFRDRPRYAYSPKKVLMYQINDSRVEQEWAQALESWGIGNISISSRDALIANLHRAQLVLFDLDRYPSDIFDIVSLKSSRPVIPLVAVGSEAEAPLKIEVLEAGVDDYVDKSCSARELVARVRAILRRWENSTDRLGEHFDVGWSMDKTSREVRSPNGARVFLSGIEFDLMKVFIDFPDRIFSAEELSMKVFSDNRRRSNAGIARLIGNIRMKFESSSVRARVIQTIQHKGYRLIHELEALEGLRTQVPGKMSFNTRFQEISE